MKAVLLTLASLALPHPAAADTLVAARTIRSHAIIAAQDLQSIAGTVPGALTHPASAIGQEARVVLYAGRPIRPEDIGAPAVIERNQLVTLIYARGGLEIAAEGRAMGRAGVGDALRVMNQSSRTTVTGRVTEAGTVRVGPATSSNMVDR